MSDPVISAGNAPSERETGVRSWLTPGVRGVGAASFLADCGHEVVTALLPSFLTSTLGAPAAALGVIEGLADGAAGLARFGGGALADDPPRRRSVAVGGYATTAVFSALIGLTIAVWQVAMVRIAAWAARGLRVPARNALLADVVSPNVYGKAYGFERAMDNLGAIGGPLLALALVALAGVRTAIAVSVVPGLLAALAIVYAVRHAPLSIPVRKRQPIRLRLRPVLQGKLGRLMISIGAFELGNVATTMLILRATQLFDHGHSHTVAVQLALGAYVLYNVAAAVSSMPAGRLSDRRGNRLVFGLGAGCFLIAYLGLATSNLILVVMAFAVAGVAIGCAETAQHAVVASLAPPEMRGSAFGLLAGVQSLGNFGASAVAGLLWTVFSPTIAFLYLAGWMGVSLLVLGWLRVGKQY